jgi:hypothetical protein
MGSAKSSLFIGEFPEDSISILRTKTMISSWVYPLFVD